VTSHPFWQDYLRMTAFSKFGTSGAQAITSLGRGRLEKQLS